MVNTTISQITPGDTVALSSGPENKYPAKADGTAKAGHLVGLSGTTNTVIKTNAGTIDQFAGILEKRYDIAIDTAVGAGTGVQIIEPRSGRRYACWITDQNGSLNKGSPLIFGAAGDLTTIGGGLVGSGGTIVAYLDENIVDNDTVARVRWA